jgi:hypothetical protein
MMVGMEQGFHEKKYYTPAEAVQYLKEQRGIAISVAGLRTRRKRGQVKTGCVIGNIALWTKEELDAVEPLRRQKREHAASADTEC